MKYRFRDASGDADADLDATWWRVARALAAPERDPELWAGRFHEAPAGLQVPAGRPRHRRRRHRPQRHAVQLLRHGHDPRRHVGHLRESARSGAHHAAGRRHRARFLDAASAGRAGEGRRRRRLGPAVLHGRLGFDVPHHHERGLAPRRHDGDAALRSSRHRGLRRRQARSQAAAHVQRLGAGHRRLHAGGEGRRRLGPRVRRQGLQDAARPRALWERIMRATYDCRRAGRDLHRPRQPAEQPPLLRDHPGDEPVRHRRELDAYRRRTAAGQQIWSDAPFVACVDGKDFASDAARFLRDRRRSRFAATRSGRQGYSLRLTADHRVRKRVNRLHAAGSRAEWVAAGASAARRSRSSCTIIAARRNGTGGRQSRPKAICSACCWAMARSRRTRRSSASGGRPRCANG